MLRPLILILALSTGLAACDKMSGKGDKKEAEAPVTLIIAPEDVMTLQGSAIVSGPVVTGSIQPARKADLRAEISAVVLQVMKELPIKLKLITKIL